LEVLSFLEILTFAQDRRTSQGTYYEDGTTAGPSSVQLIGNTSEARSLLLKHGTLGKLWNLLDEWFGVKRDQPNSEPKMTQGYLEKCWKLIVELGNKLEQDKSEQSELQMRYKSQEHEMNQLQNRADASERDKQNLLEECNAFDDKMRALQERSLRKMSDGRWIAPDDSKTYDRLRSLRTQIKFWAEEFGIGALEGLNGLNSEDERGLKEYLRCAIYGTESAPVPHDIPPTKATSIMLTALLSHEIHKKIIGNPFFFLDDEAVDGTQPPSSTLWKLYQELIKSM
jgi:hypothetical protein